MAFQARWSEFARAGWKSQQSTGLSYDIIDIMPGKKKRGGVRGRDYFVGEEELMKYLDRIDLVTASIVSVTRVCFCSNPVVSGMLSAELKELQDQQLLPQRESGNQAKDEQSVLRPSTRSSGDENSASPTHGDISDAHPGEVSVHLDAAPATPTSASAHADNIHGVSPHDTTYEGGGIDSAEEDDNDASALAISPQTRRNLDDEFADADDPPSTTPGRQPQLEQAATPDEEAKEESSRPQLEQVATLNEKTKEDSSRPGAVSKSQIDSSANSVIYASLDSDAEDDEGRGWNDEELAGD
ncbi:hypothetical protein PC128_g10628 [Phytophthora cactorum]|nr:hypothetical protein PC120_g4021 [Phytophthora cactorum]KAG3192178.1 hypothetical protein PC128_g10628 [Phytophthora cactorum]